MMVPLHADLRVELEGWSGSPYVLTAKGEPCNPESFRAGLDAPDEWYARRPDQAGRFYLPRVARVELRESPRGRM